MGETVGKHERLEGPLDPIASVASGERPGVLIQERHGVTQVQVIARSGKEKQLASRLARHLGRKAGGRKTRLAPLEGAERNGLFICATGPAEYWVLAEKGAALRNMKTVLSAIGDNGSVFDQSGGRSVLRISGRRVACALAKGTALDLHESAFPAQGASHTMIEHMPVLLVKRGTPGTYDISVARSYAGSFVIWLREAAREYGYVVKEA